MYLSSRLVARGGPAQDGSFCSDLSLVEGGDCEVFTVLPVPVSSLSVRVVQLNVVVGMAIGLMWVLPRVGSARRLTRRRSGLSGRLCGGGYP